ncbi:MAG: hypothetical protein R6V07_10525 [Armatimonadota bacterium]
MADEQRASNGGARAFDIVGGVIGLLVFIAGIAMIILVFTWVRDVFDTVDTQVQQVRTARVQAEAAGAEAAAEAQAAGDEVAEEDVVVATPYEGPTIADVGITVGLKILGLLVLGWLGALVASRGAQLAGAHRGKREL